MLVLTSCLSSYQAVEPVYPDSGPTAVRDAGRFPPDSGWQIDSGVDSGSLDGGETEDAGCGGYPYHVGMTLLGACGSFDLPDGGPLPTACPDDSIEAQYSNNLCGCFQCPQ